MESLSVSLQPKVGEHYLYKLSGAVIEVKAIDEKGVHFTFQEPCEGLKDAVMKLDHFAENCAALRQAA
jgi:hypothetical protein